MDYSRRLQQMSGRYNPDNLPLQEQREFSNETIYDGDVVKYVKRAMCAVGPEYTKRTKEAGEMAKLHLQARIPNISFEYQGSVMTDTHIKGASDIDLLVVCEKFYGTDIFKVREELQNEWKYNYEQRNRLQQYSSSFSLYQGDSDSDLRQLRLSIESIMSSHYDICDISKPKSVKITNKHLHRDVDIVTSSWFQSFDYVINGMPKERRGIKIYNKDLNCAEGPDFPFLSISLINNRSAETQGRLKKMIRFLKNVRTDSDQEINLSSFDINAICYSIPVYTYQNADYKELVSIVWKYMYDLLANNNQDNLLSVVGDEYVFRGKPEKVLALQRLKSEVFSIKLDLDKA
ncbi:MAG: hypothetical protein MJY97_00160 [Bacteroidales bacterium]|nr:hypothetical protein [Bacteroidales bacterium]